MPGISKSKTSTSRAKVRAHRERLRRKGLRPIQIWVPDVRAPAFRAAARKQSQAVAESSQDAEDQAFIDSISEQGDA
ncbi:antitoxin MazE family protein [Bradyrhizobium sp. LHD-71]|uniref:antitoxin MazE family protein n=1 Tax=Bradyrhizobium sp. LHD-71 TaxID=3072141 RepID=UPI00280EA45D|nr:antitoxin MazE family protein [Bradyrhizobium sp. LHD-71]MDQ8732254.1 antitoxin MazE family protein [Bradyrhizobium sp. LHD-71]